MILNIDGSRSCVLMAQDLLNQSLNMGDPGRVKKNSKFLTPSEKEGGQQKNTCFLKRKSMDLCWGGVAEKENQTFMLRMIRWASVNLKLKTEWNYYSYLAKISVKLLISAENLS